MTGVLSSVAVVGGCGGFGRLFAAHLQALSWTVTTIDIDPSADVVCDLHNNPQPFVDALAQPDLVLLCVPEDLALVALQVADGHTRADQLIVDICSVKSRICAAAEVACKPSQYVSVHPMFAPERGFAGHNMVMIDVRGGPAGAELREVFRAWQLNLVEANAATHDQVTSLVQVLAHATLIAFAEAESRMPVPRELVEAMATPIYSALSATAQGLLAENPQLYHNIQTANPGGDTARQVLQDAVRDTAQRLGQEDAQLVAELFQRLRQPREQ
ncbi:MAG: prephenate dehydrogenase [Pseudomonadota bacterium]